MLPVELASLPKVAVPQNVYVDGQKLKLENSLIVIDHVLYAPVYEMCSLLGFYKVDSEREMLRYDVNRAYYMYESKLMAKNDYGPCNEYDLKSINEVIFVDVLFFVREIGITVTCGQDTKSVFFVTVPHFNGYMIMQEHFFDKEDTIVENFGKYLCTEGYLSEKRQEGYIFSIIGTSENIFLNSCDEVAVNENKYQIICFQLESMDEKSHMVSGRLLEVDTSSIGFENRLGNMAYTDIDWVQICRKLPGFADLLDGEGKINKDALITIFSRYPFILKDRNALSYWLHSLFPENEKEKNLLLTAFDNGIFKAIAAEDQFDDCFMHDMVQRLMDNNGIALKYAWNIVCLCCEVYGKRVKGKKYIQKEKYCEKMQLLIMQREEKWIEPELSRENKIGKASYLLPRGWRYRYSYVKKGGMYFYPYDDDSAQIYICCTESKKATLYEEFDFDSYFAAMAHGDSKNLISISEYVLWPHIKGKKANIFMDISDKSFELDVFCFPVNGNIYTISFGEETVLTDKMQRFEGRFLKHFNFGTEKNNNDEPDVEGWREDSFLTIGIDELDLSKNTVEALETVGVCSLGELTNLTSNELMHISNIGKISYEEIIEELDKLGFYLREDDGGVRESHTSCSCAAKCPLCDEGSMIVDIALQKNEKQVNRVL